MIQTGTNLKPIMFNVKLSSSLCFPTMLVKCNMIRVLCTCTCTWYMYMYHHDQSRLLTGHGISVLVQVEHSDWNLLATGNLYHAAATVDYDLIMWSHWINLKVQCRTPIPCPVDRVPLTLWIIFFLRAILFLNCTLYMYVHVYPLNWEWFCYITANDSGRNIFFFTQYCNINFENHTLNFN